MSKSFNPVNFGRYLLTDRIAIGGMAEIFSAKIFGAMGFEKTLVIKRILPQFAADSEFLRMFITEAKLVCHLEHPNIVQVNELSEIDGQYFITMEFVHGIDGRQLWRTLAKRKQRLPGVLALFVVAEFLKGLDFAHRAVGPDNRLLGVVHRDVSPSNVLISYRGDVKIGDFGIALVQQESKTQAGVLKGKYGYMSPEQVAGLNVDHRSDIFAAGIVLAELLLGRRLFLGKSDFETLDKVMNVKLDVLEQHESALPEDVIRIVKLALQREPGDRYQSAREFHDDIMEFLFQRGERVTSETLAAFIAQHVAPYLSKKDDSKKEKNGAAAHSAQMSPVLPGGIVPRDISTQEQSEVTNDIGLESSPTNEQYHDENFAALNQLPTEEREPSDGISLEFEIDDGTADPEDSVTGQRKRDILDTTLPFDGKADRIESRATPHSRPTNVDRIENDFNADIDGLLSTDTPVSEQTPIKSSSTDFSIEIDEPSKSENPIHPASTQTNSSDMDAVMPLWDNMIDADYQFGAIPQLELNERSDSFPELDLEGFDADEHRARASAPQGFIEAPGTEFELDSGLEENVAYLIPGVVPQTYTDPASEAIINAQLGSAKAASDPDFAGKLSTRTVVKVLFRFGLVEETGLLTLTGPMPKGIYLEHRRWLHQLIADATKRSPDQVPHEHTCEIVLEDGQPRQVAADRSEEGLVAYLITGGTLKKEEVQSSVMANPHRSLVAGLISAGLLGPLQVSRHVTAHVLDTVFDSFAWNSGSFAFYRNKKVTHESFPTGLNLIPLINKGVSQLADDALEDYFRDLKNQQIIPSQTPPAEIAAFDPGPEMIVVYDALNRGYLVQDLLAECGKQANLLAVKKALYTLIECELAELA